MGIDIYARWPAQTAAEKEAQCTGFSIEHGHVGYLREAHHGEPYATRVLVPEAFDHETHPEGAAIPAKTLRERLAETLDAATPYAVDVEDGAIGLQPMVAIAPPFNFTNSNALAEQWFRKPPNFHVHEKKLSLSQDAAEMFRA